MKQTGNKTHPPTHPPLNGTLIEFEFQFCVGGWVDGEGGGFWGGLGGRVKPGLSSRWKSRRFQTLIFRRWFSPQQPAELPQCLCTVRACFPSSIPQSTLLFNGIYQNREKTKSIKKHFAWLRLVLKNAVFENCEFSKRASNT